VRSIVVGAAVLAGIGLAASCKSYGEQGESGGAADAAADGATGSTDASSTDVDSPNGGPCDGGATFCDDFEMDPLGARWSRVATASSGQVALQSPGHSGGRALRASTTGAQGAEASLIQTFAGPARSIVCTTWMKVENLSSTLSPVMDIHILPPGYSDYVVALYLSTTTTRFFRLSSVEGTTQNDLAALQTGTWLEVRLDARLSPPPASATLFLDGTQVAQLPLADAVANAVMPSLELGIGVSPAGAQATIWYDDVSCDLTK